MNPVVVLAAIPISLAPAGFKPALIETLGRIGLPVAGSVAYRLPPAGRGMAAANPPPPSPPPVPLFVAAPAHPTLTRRPVPAPLTTAPALPLPAWSEPELAALMIGDLVTPDRKLASRSEPVTEVAVVAPLAEDVRLAEGEWVEEWVAEGLVPDETSAMLAPPPPLDAPAPVVPAFEPTFLSPAARSSAAPARRRKRWFRIIEA